MPTLYERVNQYLEINRKASIPDEVRCIIGKLVVEEFIKLKPEKAGVHHRTFKTPKGEVRVADYPGYFVPIIDGIIHKHLQGVPELPSKPRPLRKRIPAKPIRYLR